MAQITALQHWGPFKIDALGIITLLGAEQVSVAFGRLVNNRYSNALPTVGAYVFPANTYTTPVPGFHVYNVDDKMSTVDVPGWFSRWLLSRNVKTNATKFEFKYKPPGSRSALALAVGGSISTALGVLAHAPTIILAVLIRDWWGLANAICMALSTLSRFALVQQNKRALETNANESEGWSDGTVPKRSFWLLPTGNAVRITAPKGLLVNCLLTNPKTRGPLQLLVRTLGWAAFGGFAVTLGMSTLFIQILTVVIVLACTCFAVWGVGDDTKSVGTRIEVVQEEHAEDSDRRAEAYFRLDLSSEDEDFMIHQSLMPMKAARNWWEPYDYCKAKGSFEEWTRVLNNYAR